MNRNNPPERIDPMDLLSEHYEAIEMSDACRLDIQNRTRSAVAARGRVPVVRWAMGLSGVTALIAVIALCLHMAGTPQRPIGGHLAVRPNAPHGKPPVVAKHNDSKHNDRPSKQEAPDVKKTALRPTVKGAAPVAPKSLAAKAGQTLGEPIVVIVSVRPPVKALSGTALSIGDRVRSGDTIRTGLGGQVTMVTRKGSELVLGSNSSLVIPSDGAVVVDRGRLYCSNRDKEIARIDTPAGRVKLLGTVVDTNVVRKDTVAVTVVKGKVQLSNRHGSAVVDAGKQSMLLAFRPPQAGRLVNTYKETSWYHGKGDYESDFGDMAYTVARDGITEVWVMNADGSAKHRVKSYLGSAKLGQWVPGERWLSVDCSGGIAVHSGADGAVSMYLGKAEQWLLDAATGQSRQIPGLPTGYDGFYFVTSPDQTKVAFSGYRLPDPGSSDASQPGLYVFDRMSGTVSKMVSGDIKTAAAWAPDSRRIAISSGQGYSIDHRLLIIDTATGHVRDLGINGAGACFSPDGRRIAYCGDFRRDGGYSRGVPITGSVFVLDLSPGAKPVRVTPAGKDVVAPRWSPDGTRILCSSLGWNGLMVTHADGTGAKEIYTPKCDGDPSAASWAPSGDAVYAVVSDGAGRQSDGQRTIVIAADGSRTKDVPVGNGKNSNLPPVVRAQTDAACAAIQEAVSRYSAGSCQRFRGNINQAREDFAWAADAFERLVWDYPLAGLTPDDTLPYADTAAKLANESDDDILAECCGKRIEALSEALFEVVRNDLRFPSDMQSLRERLSQVNPDLILECPGTSSQDSTPLVYSPPAPGALPAVGDTLISCPVHGGSRAVWEAWMAQALDEQIVRDLRPGQARLYYFTPYAFENVGDDPLSVVYHKFTHKYEVKGTAKLLPTGKVYSNEQFTLPDNEADMARDVDAAGALDWGHLSETDLSSAKYTLSFCRAVAKCKSGQKVTDADLGGGGSCAIIDGEPAVLLFRGDGGSWGCIRSDLRFAYVGPGKAEMYQLEPSGRFRVSGTVRVVKTGEVCKNGWIDKDGKVISTEK